MPKIKFKEMSLEDNIEIVKWCYYDQNKNDLLEIHKSCLNLFPELKNIPSNYTKEETNKYIGEIVTKYYNNRLEIIKESIKRYDTVWAKYNDVFFKELCSYLEIDWPKDKEVIESTIGVIPVSPRNIDEFSFSTHEDITDNQLIETCAHECCHFLWFEKWKNIYPDYNREDFESPHIIWEYSEMVVDPILNSESIEKVLNRKSRYAYDSFFEENGLMEGLFEIYDENIPIETKISKGFDYVNKTKKR